MGFVGIPIYYMRGIINRRGWVSDRLIRLIHNERTANPGENPFDIYVNVLVELHGDWLEENPEPFVDFDDDLSIAAWDSWHVIKECSAGQWCPVCDHHIGPFRGIKDGRAAYLEHARTCPIWEVMDVELDFAPGVDFNERFRFRNP